MCIAPTICHLNHRHKWSEYGASVCVPTCVDTNTCKIITQENLHFYQILDSFLSQELDSWEFRCLFSTQRFLFEIWAKLGEEEEGGSPFSLPSNPECVRRGVGQVRPSVRRLGWKSRIRHTHFLPCCLIIGMQSVFGNKQPKNMLNIYFYVSYICR